MPIKFDEQVTEAVRFWFDQSEASRETTCPFKAHFYDGGLRELPERAELSCGIRSQSEYEGILEFSFRTHCFLIVPRPRRRLTPCPCDQMKLAKVEAAVKRNMIL